ncbi:regulator of microtubule dynamics protein 2 isoform X1 [Eptesicus fuscus]|uniref:regulator of microtubule dynamics protein 2 isoform X1 n=1 Tax=Eptesicus fuscus TaxID=29078 RepID=UPI002403A7D5|nr:regulator of microtubule dynamics protein 2 isoform X1 [Eptesicus fuscus]
MPHSTNKELILGIMVGTTGISLLLLWYHKVCKPRTTMNLSKFLSLGDAFDSVTLQDEMQKDQGTAAIFQGRQLQILEKLNELLTNMEELREEIRILKETIPKLEECVRGELGGKTRISPQHRARKRRIATVQSSGTSNSSEEAESEGGCCKKDQNFQQNCPADQVTSDPLHHGTSSVSHQPKFLNLPTNRPKVRKVSIRRGSKNFTTSSTISAFSSPSNRRQSLFGKFQKSSGSLQRQPSRANFDSEDKSSISDIKISSEHFAFRSRRPFSTPKLSIISCYESAMWFDLQSSSENMVDPSEIEVASKISSTAVEKYLSSCSPDYNTKHFINFETKVHSSANPTGADRDHHRRSTATYLSLPTLISHSYLQSDIASATQEGSQPKEEFLPDDFQSHSASRPSAVTSGSGTSVPHNVAFASFYKHTRRFTPLLNEVISDSFDDGNIAKSSQDEDKSPPIEIPNLRYITASTDTEEQSFPVPKALNIHVKELNLDVLLQKADNLRMDESKKMESFELLCDHKEKFRDEIEFIWRLVRAYGDMYELSTNTEEKKHYANIGRTLGEKAVTRAPMNGHCHLWYAVLCGYVSEFEGLQNKVNYGYCFKEHLDKAIQLIPAEPFLYYLNGRYCYAVSKLSWIEKKMAATLFGKIPSSTIQEALQNFLKVEELHPGFSKSNYMYLSKCYRDLKQIENAKKFRDLAEQLPCITREDKNAEEEVQKISMALKK